MDTKGEKRQLLRRMALTAGSANQVLGKGQMKLLCWWNLERPYLADGKSADFEGWIGVQQVRKGIPVGGNSKSIVIEVRCLDLRVKAFNIECKPLDK